MVRRPGARQRIVGVRNRGVEVTGEVMNLPQTLITTQVTNGVAVRMAVFYQLQGANENAQNADS